MDYGTVAGFRAYHTARGRDLSAWDDDAEIEAAKLVASEWIDARYQGSFPGTKVGMRDQMREWPRVGGVDRDGYTISSSFVPTEIENATYEATYRQLGLPGSLSVDWTPPKYNRVSVDGAISVEYARFYGASDVQTRFAIIDEILAPILTRCFNSTILSGSITRV